MPNYSISKKARLDIIGIWEYTLNNWSLEQADIYYGFLIKEIEYIANHPEIGKNYRQVKTRYLGRKMKSHIIFYKVSSQSRIEIIRILHQRMDIEIRLIE